MPNKLDRLKAQLRITGLQREDPPLFQVINALIDALQAFELLLSGGSGGNGTVASNFEFLTGNNESILLPNSRQLLAGIGISFDDLTPNQRTINTTGISADYVVASDGFNPPSPIDDGFGNFVYVAYTP